MKPTKPYYDNYAQQVTIAALLEMMEERDYDEIAISDLCDRAKIARRTFYLHYKTKRDVLEDYFRVLTREYDDKFEKTEHLDALDQIDYFFSFWYRHRDYLRVLDKQNLFYILFSRFNDYLSNLARYEGIDIPQNYPFAYTSGGLWAVLYAWTKDDFREDRKRLASEVYRMHLRQQQPLVY